MSIPLKWQQTICQPDSDNSLSEEEYTCLRHAEWVSNTCYQLYCTCQFLKCVVFDDIPWHLLMCPVIWQSDHDLLSKGDSQQR